MTDRVHPDNPPVDPYDPAWTAWNTRHPRVPKSVGAAADEGGEGNDGGEGDAASATAGDKTAEPVQDTAGQGTGEQHNKPADPKAADAGQAGDDKGGKSDGEDWRGQLPDDLAKTAQKFNSPADALKSYQELQKRLGNSVALPGKDATPEDVQEFRKKALGVPDDPTGYEVQLPKDLPEELQLDEQGQARLEDFKKKMHEAGAPPDAVQAAVDSYYGMLAETLEQQGKAREQAREQAEGELRKEWGSDFDANVNFGRRALNQFDTGDGRFRQFVENAQVDGKALGDHPEFLRMFAQVGRRMAEDTVHLEPTEQEASDLNKQVDRLRQERSEAMAKGDRKRAQELDEKERQIYARMQGNAPIVGSGGRAV